MWHMQLKLYAIKNISMFAWGSLVLDGSIEFVKGHMLKKFHNRYSSMRVGIINFKNHLLVKNHIMQMVVSVLHKPIYLFEHHFTSFYGRLPIED